MKSLFTRKLIFGFFAFAFAFASFSYLLYSPTEPEPLPNDRFEEKHEPSDEFFMQRVNADGVFSFDSYANALKQAKETVQLRTISGFGEDWVTQGPGNIGARANVVTVHPTNENIIYAGFSGGGVFKTEDGGATWNPIFDDQVFLAIGDIVLDPVDPNIVYVGTGDVNINGYTFLGDGLYRSMDGGDSWTNLGLEEQRIISKVVVNPIDNNKIFTATMGNPFVRNNERGLYRSIDNGTSWEQVLFLSDSTGIIDVVMNPNNPDILFAVGWDRIRNNIESIIRGEGAKIYKTIDGGDNWELVEGGLPNDDPHGRVGLAIYDANPNIIYAQYIGVNSQLEDIYRTEDGGETWTPIPIDENQNGLDEGAMGGFGWYFGKIRVNPNNPDDIYLLGIDLWRTQDRGENWELASPEWWTYDVHADKHDLTFLIDGGVLLATDGGLYRSDADNETWEDIENIPTTQFYRVGYNPHEPDIYYGGAQDNGTTGGNVDSINSWARIYGGDGFQTVFDPDNPDRIFAETQRGRINVSFNGGGGWTPADIGIDNGDRRNWDMPYFISPHNSSIFYTGTYRVYAGVGQDVPAWDFISLDLTDGTAEEHRYHNISAIDESPIVEGLLYVGTGDGNLWKGNGSGNNWTSIVNGLPDLYVTDVIGSPTDENVVFVTYSGYRDNEFTPRIFRSDDQGDTWTDISSNLPDLAINELLVIPETNDSILFVATDGGVFGTVTAGTEWERLGANMPVIAVYDMVHNVAKNELVAGTFGRSILSYPLDSIAPIEDDPMVNISEPKAIANKGIKVYPNPANDFVQIEIQNIEEGRGVSFVVISVDGKLMHQSENVMLEKINHRLNISDFPSGQYFIKAKMRHQVITTSFVKI